MKYLVLLAVPSFLVIYMYIKALRRRSRHRALARKPFPAEWLPILEKNLPPYSNLSDDQRKKLHWYIQVFLDEKIFEGCGGQEITDEVRVTIAAQACILLLGHTNRMYPTLKTILVYPHTYTAEGQPARLGESWQSGPVVLSWNSVKGGAVNFDDGENVAIHEFAHQLDQEDGAADGAPILDRSHSSYKIWASVFSKEFKALQKKKRKFRKSVMSKYGATNPAEFFAVATEAFYEKPEQMKKRHAELYTELKNYYGVDPLEWKAE